MFPSKNLMKTLLVKVFLFKIHKFKPFKVSINLQILHNLEQSNHLTRRSNCEKLATAKIQIIIFPLL